MFNYNINSSSIKGGDGGGCKNPATTTPAPAPTTPAPAPTPAWPTPYSSYPDNPTL